MGYRVRAAVIATLLAVGATPALAASDEVDMVADTANQCKLGDFDSFFMNFAMNPQVKDAYTDAQVEIRSLAKPSQPGRVVARAAYRGQFVIRSVDYLWYDAKSLNTDDSSKWVNIKITRKALPGNAYRIDYVRAQYDGKGDGDSPGELVRTLGKPGAYVFAFKDGCWRLTQDLR